LTSSRWFASHREKRLEVKPLHLSGRAIRSMLVSLLAMSVARAVSPSFTAVAPAGGKRGSQLEVTLRGDRLSDAQEIFVYRPGITVERIVEATDKQVRAVLQIAEDCPLGEHFLRIRTASGISALRLFYVGPFAAVEEKEPNNSAGKPQSIAWNHTVQGTLTNEDGDFFVVEARKDQRFSIEVEGARLGRTMLDPYVAVYAPGGKRIAESDDTPLLGHDGFVSFLAPEDGKYVIELRDIAYSGAGHFYRMHVGDFPRPALATPLGGKAGETIDVRFIGDPTGDVLQKVSLPAAAATARFAVVAEREGSAASPNWVRVSEFPNAEAVSASPTIANAPLLKIEPPFAFNGTLEKKGEAAFFRFKGRKDQSLDFQVHARRLGSPIDSVLTILNSKGASLGSNDDAGGHPDSATRVKLPEDGYYTVKIADQLGRGGPLYAFRVEVAEVRPVITLSIPDTARYDNETRKSLAVPRGNRFAVLLNINRDGFNGDVDVAWNGLPAGISSVADSVPGSVSAVPVVFEAAADAPIAGNLLTPIAKSLDPKSPTVTSRYRHAVDWVRIQNDTVYVRSEVNRIAAAVVEEVPFKVRIVEPKVPIVQNGEMNLQVVAERAEGFDEPITLKMLWNPPGMSSLPEMVIPKGSDAITYKLNATAKAEARKWKTAVIAGASVKGAVTYVSSQLAEIEIAPTFLIGKMELTKIERGQTGRMVCTLEQKTPFEGTAIAKLVGLPDKATAKEVEITKDSREIVFEVVTTDKTPTGITKNVFCNVVVTQSGEPISHVIASGSVLRIDPPRAGSVAAVAKTNPMPVAQHEK
jgi:hypothetical protein